MKRKLLVVSTVHPADDPRIRRKLIGTLQPEWDVTFAGRGAAPLDTTGFAWRKLGGNRAMAWVRAGRLLLSRQYDVASLHDPELLPLGLGASVLGRRVVFDLHENLPGQLRTKEWLPRPIRRPLARLAAGLLHLAERLMPITLAEAGYGELFRKPHPVFPNYLTGGLPAPRPFDPAIGIVYLGDVTEARGIPIVVEAAGRAGADVLTIMGRCAPDFRDRLQALGDQHGLRLEFHGFVDPATALGIVAGSRCGVAPLLDTPNYRSSLPTKVLEYLAMGVPALASDLPGTHTVVAGRPGAVLVRPGDVDSWTEAIREVWSSDALRVAARDAASQVRDDFAWPSARVADFYRSQMER